MRKQVFVFILFLISFGGAFVFLIDISNQVVLHTFFYNSGAVVEVDNRAEFEEKAQYIQNLDGTTVVLVGDSFILGKSLKEVVGLNWRDYTLDKYLQRCLRSRIGNKSLHVVNLGANGLLPADINVLTSVLKDLRVDFVLFDINSRSFASDFNKNNAQFSRDWIHDMDSSGAVNYIQKFQAQLSLLKKYIFKSSPTDMGKRISIFASNLFGVTADKSEISNNILLLKLKKRYKNASYSPVKSFQAQALGKLLANKSVFAFRVLEENKLFRLITSKSQREQLDRGLNQLIGQTGVQLLTSPVNLVKSDYIDLFHVKPSGYEKYAETLCDSLVPQLIKEN